MTGFRHLRSPLGFTVKVHATDLGSVRIYKRWGWEEFLPVAVSSQAIVDARS